ncbi:hypothetical protein PTT46_24125, partial [Serratia ureilytica]|uniref:hypothetical protein n=2 Tax=Serratia ureilytica TaxID=300181 RepID=UPI00313BAFF4
PPRYCRQANSVSFQPPHFREAIRTNLGTSLKIIRIILILTPSGPTLRVVQNRSRRFCLSKNTFGVVRLSLTDH